MKPMRRGGFWLVTLALLSAACRNPSATEPAQLGAAPVAAGPAPIVLGTTVDARTGKPVANVLVRGPDGVETRSDAQGRFVLRGLTAGVSGELVGTTESGLNGRNKLRSLAGGPLEVVLYLR